MGTKLAPARFDSSCNARATSSLPVPLSPVMRTVAVELATREIKSRMDCAASLAPLNDVMRDDLDMKNKKAISSNFSIHSCIDNYLNINQQN
jgi:hypothetical protein